MYIDISSLKGFKKAEKEKTRLENKGYNLKKVIQVGIYHFISIYRK